MTISRIVVTFYWLVAGCLLITPCNKIFAQRPSSAVVFAPPEGCTPFETIEPENICSFARAEVQALSVAERGEQANDLLKSDDLRIADLQIPEIISGLREERKADACAASILAGYMDSRNTYVATVARYMVLAYQDLGYTSDQMLPAVMAAQLKQDAEYIRSQLAQVKVKRVETQARMTDALQLTLLSLVDDNRKNAAGNPDHLLLSRAQRDELLQLLQMRFPALKAQPSAQSAGAFLKQAALIRSFLTGSYKASDE